MSWNCSILNSHLSYYLQNNQAPTAEDEKKVLSLRETLNADILAIQERSNGSCDETEVIESDHRAALQSSLSRCQIILSPSRFLPKEMWGEIFVRCLPTDRYPTLSYQEAPLLLTHVSASWKEIALSTPEIWTRIELLLSQFPRNPLSPRSDTDDEFFGDKVSQWLQSSGSLPLKISVSAKYAVRSSWHGQHLKTIFSFSNRLVCLSLDFYLIYSYNLTLPTHTEVPLLETLFMRTANADELVEPTSILHAPSLRHLSIGIIQYRNISIPHTWSKLHTLSINNMIDRIAARKILTQCKCLVDCSLVIMLVQKSTDPNYINMPIIFHPRLESLTLTYPGQDSLTPDSLFEDLHPSNLAYFEWRVDTLNFWAPISGEVHGDGTPGLTPTRNFLPQLDKLETVAINGKGGIPSLEKLSAFLKNLPSCVKTLKIDSTSFHPVADARYLPLESSIQFILLNLQQRRSSPEPTLSLPNLEKVDYFSNAITSLIHYFQIFILSRTSINGNAQIPSPGPRFKKVTVCILEGEGDMEGLENICREVSDHIRNSRVAFRLEIYSRKDASSGPTKLLKEVVFDPEYADRLA